MRVEGGAAGTRTPCLGIANAALSQMSYSPTSTVYGATFNAIRFTRIGSSAPLQSIISATKNWCQFGSRPRSI